MKIIILNSPLFRDKNDRYDEDALPPIGLGLIATSLQDKGFDVELIDAVALNIPLQNLIVMVLKKKPSFVCINVFTTNLQLVKEFIEGIYTRTHFIIGGLSTQSLFAEIFTWKSNNPIDIVHGDGERIVSDIVAGNINQTPANVSGHRRYFEVHGSSPYYVEDISEDKLNRSFFVNEPVIHPLGFIEANIITSRGCIYNCAFCAAARSLNQQFNIREKSESSIIS
jgi:anaerobic magnesium-protoporphyrin IX monomethyl ester cyclase